MLACYRPALPTAVIIGSPEPSCPLDWGCRLAPPYDWWAASCRGCRVVVLLFPLVPLAPLVPLVPPAGVALVPLVATCPAVPLVRVLVPLPARPTPVCAHHLSSELVCVRRTCKPPGDGRFAWQSVGVPVATGLRTFVCHREGLTAWAMDGFCPPQGRISIGSPRPPARFVAPSSREHG